MHGRAAFALLMAMRTGKTKVLLDDWGEMVEANEVQDLFVSAPGGVYRTWEGEARKHLPEEMQERTLIHTWTSGGGVGYRRSLEKFLRTQDPKRPRIFLVNIEALSSVEAARAACLEFLSQRRKVGGIDESTIIKNDRAERTKFVVQKLAPLMDYRRILSGLPTPRSPLDIFSQFEFLDWRILGFRSFYAFRAHYAILKNMDFGGRIVKVVVDYRNVEELQELIAPHSFRVTLDQVRAATPPVYSIREVNITAEQKKAYREIKEFATTQLASGEHVTASAVITQILRLHQVLCGYVVDEEGRTHEIPERRTTALLDILNDYDGKAIIWCSYDYNVKGVSEALTKEFGEGSTARFWGGNRDTREEEERHFKEDDGCRFMVATAAAGGRGRTWSMADLTVYFSNTHDLEHRSQSEERTEAVDKLTGATRIDLIAPGTVDEKIIQALRNKINMAASITGDSWREWLI